MNKILLTFTDALIPKCVDVLSNSHILFLSLGCEQLERPSRRHHQRAWCPLHYFFWLFGAYDANWLRHALCGKRPSQKCEEHHVEKLFRPLRVRRYILFCRFCLCVRWRRWRGRFCFIYWYYLLLSQRCYWRKGLRKILHTSWIRSKYNNHRLLFYCWKEPIRCVHLVFHLPLWICVSSSCSLDLEPIGVPKCPWWWW